jgi:hypothetical protein
MQIFRFDRFGETIVHFGLLWTLLIARVVQWAVAKLHERALWVLILNKYLAPFEHRE